MTTLYRFYDVSGQLIYVGITDSPLRRFDQHAVSKGWWWKAESVFLEHFETRAEAEEAERQAIKSEFPPENIAHRLPLTWDALTAIEPRLLDLMAEARMSTDPLRDWYGWWTEDGYQDGIKQRLMRLVGFGAVDKSGHALPSPLGDDRAYELCYRKLWTATAKQDRWSA